MPTAYRTPAATYYASQFAHPVPSHPTRGVAYGSPSPQGIALGFPAQSSGVKRTSDAWRPAATKILQRAGTGEFVDVSTGTVVSQGGGFATGASPYVSATVAAAIGGVIGGAIGFFVPFVGWKIGAGVGAALFGLGGYAAAPALPFGATDVTFEPGETPWDVSALSVRGGKVRAWDRYGREIQDKQILQDTLTYVDQHQQMVDTSGKQPPVMLPDVSVAGAASAATAQFQGLSAPAKIAAAALAGYGIWSLIRKLI